MEGTDTDCNCFAHLHWSDIIINRRKHPSPILGLHTQIDIQPVSTCSKLLEGADVPLDNIFKYNTWVDKADCDGSLYAGMAENETRAVCLGKRPLRPQPTVIVDETPSQEPTPTCTPAFDPQIGEYVCPDPPICHFDPEKGEYVCPDPTATGKSKAKEEEEHEELRM